MVDPSFYVSPLLSGIILGSLYALMAMGLSLIYSTVRVLNFAHGAFFMIGAYIVWWLNTPASFLEGLPVQTSNLQIPFWIGVFPAVVAMFAFGVATQRGLIRPLIKKPGSLISTLVATLALAVILQSLATLSFTGVVQHFVGEIAPGQIQFGGLILTNTELVQLLVAVGVLVTIQIFLKRFRYGIGMRAVAQDIDSAKLCGINTESIYLLAFGLGAALAAIAGILLTNIIFLSPSVGQVPLEIAFIVVVFGGIGSVSGTILASYIVATAQQYVTLISDPGWGLTFAFVLMIMVLILRPRGLFGFKET